MYLRETRRRNKDGSEVSYLALAHNERNADTGVAEARIIHNFGRADQVGREALARLVRSISRFLDPADAVAATASGEVRILDARPMGTSWVVARLWERLGIGQAGMVAAAGRRLDVRYTGDLGASWTKVARCSQRSLGDEAEQVGRMAAQVIPGLG
jgi:hypothetical protein